MLTKKQMEHVETIFERAKDNLFADGSIDQIFFILQNEHAIILPVPEHVPLSAYTAIELMKEMGETKGCDLVLYISEAWVVKEENKGQFKSMKEHIQPREYENKKEVILMTVLEVKGDQELHMKLGYIQHDDQGGAYVKEEEWMPSGGEMTPTRLSKFSDTFNA